MSWKKLFFKEDGTGEKTEVKSTAKKPASLSSAPVVNNLSVVTPVVSGTDYNNVLEEAIRKNNPAGPDYFEFSDVLRKLEGRPFTEQQKYENAFAAFESMGITSEKLVKSAESYLKVMDKEKSEFEQELAGARESGIKTKQSQMEANQKNVEEYTKRIQDLTAQNQQLAVDINSSTNELNAEEIAFNNAYTQRQNLIYDHISKIQNYLTDGKSTK